MGSTGERPEHGDHKPGSPFVRSAAVYEVYCQAPSGVFSGGANRSRRRPRVACSSPPCSAPESSPTRGPLGRAVVGQASLDPRRRLTPARPPPWRAAGPSNRPAAASPSPPLPLAAPLGPRSATRRSAAYGPRPRSPPSGRACSPRRSGADTTDSRHCPAASAATARPVPRSDCARAGCRPC